MLCVLQSADSDETTLCKKALGALLAIVQKFASYWSSGTVDRCSAGERHWGESCMCRYMYITTFASFPLTFFYSASLPVEHLWSQCW